MTEKKFSAKDHLIDLSKVAGAQFVMDVADMIDTSKSARVQELLEELSNLKIEAISSEPADAALYAEMIEDKLGSMAHVLAEEGIVKTSEIAFVVTRAAKTMLSGLAVVGKEFIKISLKATLGGVVGGALGGLGDKLVDSAIDAVVDKLSPE